MRVITGTGRSGTSFLAKVICELGYDVGVRDYSVSQPPYAGMEARGTWQINEMIMQDLGKARFPSGRQCDLLADKYRNPINAVSVQFPKDPRFCYTLPVWHKARGIELALVCVRDVHCATRSSYEAGTHRRSYDDYDSDVMEMSGRLGYLIAFLETEEVPYTTVQFPKMVTDAKYAWSRLSRMIDIDETFFVAAHRLIAQPNLVHHV